MNYKDLNPILHAPLRLAIMSFLMTTGSSDFNTIREITKATAGNLSVQLRKLESAGYIRIHKSFKNNYTHTTVELTKNGIDAFESYVQTLKKYIE